MSLDLSMTRAPSTAASATPATSSTPGTSTNSRAAPPLIVGRVLARHADEAAFLWTQRQHLLRAPQVNLTQLARHDERLEAHLDGLRVAGEVGWMQGVMAIEAGTSGSLFVELSAALEGAKDRRIADAVARAQTDALRREVISAFGWARRDLALEHARWMMRQASAALQIIGMSTFALHRVDPGASLDALLDSDDAGVRYRAFRALGELGRSSSLHRCRDALRDGDVRFRAAWSAVLLGDREVALQALARFASRPGAEQRDALCLYVMAAQPERQRSMLAGLRTTGQTRRLVQAAGWSGMAAYLPRLLPLMQRRDTARLAAESFALITGLDIRDGFELGAPDEPVAGPNEDPDDGKVAMDRDRDLPWPDVEKLAAWWGCNAHRFDAEGSYFLGQLPSVPQGLTLLQTASQQRRHLAAWRLAILQPGTPLFNCAAPGWRQRTDMHTGMQTDMQTDMQTGPVIVESPSRSGSRADGTSSR